MATYLRTARARANLTFKQWGVRAERGEGGRAGDGRGDERHVAGPGRGWCRLRRTGGLSLRGARLGARGCCLGAGSARGICWGVVQQAGLELPDEADWIDLPVGV